MPVIQLKNQAASSENVVSGLAFQDIPEPGALVSIFASTAAAGGSLSFNVGNERFCVGAQLNIESSADVIDMARDVLLDREPVPAGKMFVSTGSGAIVNVRLEIEYLPVG